MGGETERTCDAVRKPMPCYPGTVSWRRRKDGICPRAGWCETRREGCTREDAALEQWDKTHTYVVRGHGGRS